MVTFPRHIILAISLTSGLVIYGTLGFLFIVDLNLIDSIYMTLITITTIGFNEIGQWDSGDRLFVISLMIFSFVLFGFAVSVLPTFIAEYFFVENFLWSKQGKMIKRLSNHVIVCGYGGNAEAVVERLTRHKTPFVIVEQSSEVIADLKKDYPDYLVVKGNATEDETLDQVSLDKAKAVITTLPSDADNLFIVLSVRQKNEHITIISRCSQESSGKKMKLAGANNTIMPDRLGGGYMAMLVATPDVVEFMGQLNTNGINNDILLQQVHVDDRIVGKSIKNIDFRKTTGCNVIGYKDKHGEYIINPDPETILDLGTSLIVLGYREQIQSLESAFV